MLRNVYESLCLFYRKIDDKTGSDSENGDSENSKYKQRIVDLCKQIGENGHTVPICPNCGYEMSLSEAHPGYWFCYPCNMSIQ